MKAFVNPVKNIILLDQCEHHSATFQTLESQQICRLAVNILTCKLYFSLHLSLFVLNSWLMKTRFLNSLYCFL